MEHRLLTTDELLNQLDESLTDSFQADLKHHHKKRKEYYILWGIVAIAVLHLLLFSLPLMIGVHNTVSFLGRARVVGIPFVEGSIPSREGHVIVLNRYDIDEIAIGDYVVVYGIQDTAFHWEVEITDFNTTDETVSVSFDGVYSLNYTFEDIEGIYVKDANVIGIILYVSSQWRGLLATFAVYSSIILTYYILVIREMKVIEMEVDHAKTKD